VVFPQVVLLGDGVQATCVAIASFLSNQAAMTHSVLTVINTPLVTGTLGAAVAACLPVPEQACVNGSISWPYVKVLNLAAFSRKNECIHMISLEEISGAILTIKDRGTDNHGISKDCNRKPKVIASCCVALKQPGLLKIWTGSPSVYIGLTPLLVPVEGAPTAILLPDRLTESPNL
jgi:hypothetical protein